MTGFSELGLGHKLEALKQRIATVEREVKTLRRDMSKALRLLEQLAEGQQDGRANGDATESHE